MIGYDLEHNGHEYPRPGFTWHSSMILFTILEWTEVGGQITMISSTFILLKI